MREKDRHHFSLTVVHPEHVNIRGNFPVWVVPENHLAIADLTAIHPTLDRLSSVSDSRWPEPRMGHSDRADNFHFCDLSACLIAISETDAYRRRAGMCMRRGKHDVRAGNIRMLLNAFPDLLYKIKIQAKKIGGHDSDLSLAIVQNEGLRVEIVVDVQGWELSSTKASQITPNRRGYVHLCHPRFQLLRQGGLLSWTLRAN